MNKTKILIAERDFRTRLQLVRTAAERGYQVSLTGSVPPLLCCLLYARCAVVLLDDNFAENLPIVELIRLMRNCHPAVAIILISDNISLLQIRQARQLGLFYHALKPVSPDDWLELAQALECAVQSAPRQSRLPRRNTPSMHRMV